MRHHHTRQHAHQTHRPMVAEMVSERDPRSPIISFAPVHIAGGPDVPATVFMPHDRWRQWLDTDDLAMMQGGSWVKLLTDDEWPLQGGYLALGLHQDDAMAPGTPFTVKVHGGLTEHGPVAAISIEWPHPRGGRDVLVFTTLDAGEPAWRRVLNALATQSSLPVFVCDAETGAFAAQYSLAHTEDWQPKLHRIITETEGAPPCGPKRQLAERLMYQALASGQSLPTVGNTGRHGRPCPSTGRNDPCPCGSSTTDGRPRKFKRCCGDAR